MQAVKDNAASTDSLINDTIKRHNNKMIKQKNFPGLSFYLYHALTYNLLYDNLNDKEHRIPDSQKNGTPGIIFDKIENMNLHESI